MKQVLSAIPEDISGKKVLLAGSINEEEQEMAITLASHGAKVMLVGEKQQEVDQTMAKLRAIGCESNCYGMVANPKNPEDLKVIHDVIERLFRGVDLIINNNFISRTVLNSR